MERDHVVEEFYEGAEARVRRYVFGMLQDREEAADAVQETWTRYLYYVNRAQPRYELRLLLAVARNVVRDRGRRHREIPVAVVFTGATPGFEAQTEVADLVGRLPWREREVVVLHHALDLPVVEVARVVGTSVGAVKSLLFRARARLKREYLGGEEATRGAEGDEFRARTRGSGPHPRRAISRRTGGPLRPYPGRRPLSPAKGA